MYLDYLKNRASSDMILKYHLGIGPDASYRKMKLDEFLGRRSLLDQYGKAEAILRQLAGKVVIPIHDEMGQLVSFTGRRIKVNNDEVRYKRPKGLSSYGVLYGLHLAKGAIKERDQVIVIEGPFDCMSLVSLGLESRLLQNVVAMMTCSMSAYKLSVLKKYTKNIVVCLDGDKASDINTMLGIANNAMDIGVEVKFATPPNGKDPDEYVKELEKQGMTPIQIIELFQEEVLDKAREFDPFMMVDIAVSNKDLFANEMWDFIYQAIKTSNMNENLISHISSVLTINSNEVEAKYQEIKHNKALNKIKHQIKKISTKPFFIGRDRLRELAAQCTKAELLIWIVLAAEMGKNDTNPFFDVEPRTLINNSGLGWDSIRVAMAGLKKKRFVGYNSLDSNSKFQVSFSSAIRQNYLHIPFDFVWSGYASKIKHQLALFLYLSASIPSPLDSSNINTKTLAEQLNINIKTVKKGIEDLNKLGYIYSYNHNETERHLVSFIPYSSDVL